MIHKQEPTCLQITTIDLNFVRPKFASSHLIESPWGAALVDVGSGTNAKTLLQALAQKGIAPSSVVYVFLTHIHLDHAGGIGLLLRDHLPNAKVVVHPNGAKHIANPSALEAGSRTVFGDAYFNEYYGSLIAVPEEKIICALEDTVFEHLEPPGTELETRNIVALDTPGHARHHFCLWLKNEEAVFTGDTFGIAYPALSRNNRAFLFPTTTPSAFEPEQMKRSVARICETGCKSLYLTHFGRLPNPQSHALEFISRIEELTRITRLHFSKLPKDYDLKLEISNLQKEVRQWLRKHLEDLGYPAEAAGEAVELLEFDTQLNSQGLWNWWSKNSAKGLE